jgi:hypothetical protein
MLLVILAKVSSTLALFFSQKPLMSVPGYRPVLNHDVSVLKALTLWKAEVPNVISPLADGINA